MHPANVVTISNQGKHTRLGFSLKQKIIQLQQKEYFWKIITFPIVEIGMNIELMRNLLSQLSLGM